jgi:hypothetical protein
MPGAAYFELATAAAHTLIKLAAPSVALTSATIAAPFKLPAAAEAASVVLSAEVALAAGEVSIRSGAAGPTAAKGAGMLHLKGSMAAVRMENFNGVQGTAREQMPLSADAVRAACREPQPTVSVYGKLLEAGLEYGPAFRWESYLASMQPCMSLCCVGLVSAKLVVECLARTYDTRVASCHTLASNIRLFVCGT